MKPVPFERHRFSLDGICQAIWLYGQFTRPFRDLKDTLMVTIFQMVPNW